jgi:hypothetical protein
MEPTEVRGRFEEELGLTQGYLDLVLTRALDCDSPAEAFWKCLERARRWLGEAGGPDRSACGSGDLGEEPPGAGLLVAVRAALDSIGPVASRHCDRLRTQQEALASREAYALGPADEGWTAEVVGHFATRIDEPLSVREEDKQELVAYARKLLQWDVDRQGEGSQSFGVDLDAWLSACFDLGRSQACARRIRSLDAVIADLEALSVRVEAGRAESLLSPYRQAFIMLMTAFDASVFDLVRMALQRDFFRLAAAWGGDDKLAFRDLGQYASLEAVRDGIIERELKRRYIGDLLEMLPGPGARWVDESRGQTFGQLTELVQRRNAHIHNRGLVDASYLRAGSDGLEHFNPCGLKIGDYAEIDEDYWRGASELCSECVARIAEWVESLAQASEASAESEAEGAGSAEDED